MSRRPICYSSAMSQPRLLWPTLLMTFATALVAQSPAGWGSVKQISAGRDVRITMTDGRNVRGTFQSATDDAMVVATPTGQESLSHPLVSRVASKGRNHRLRNAAIGLGVGAGGGLALGAGADHSCSKSGCFPFGNNFGKELFTPLGAVAGLVVGGLWPSGIWHDLYRVK
jgi:hypothetical protein